MLNAPRLDEDIAQFIQRGVSIHVGSSSAEQVPSIARALGCRLSNDRCNIVLFISASSTSLLADLRNNRAIAAVFSQPTTLQTLQLKGRNVEFVPFTEEDQAALAAYRRAFVTELLAVGQPAEFAQAIVPEAAADVVAVSFLPTSAYVQTPGPLAGGELPGFA